MTEPSFDTLHQLAATTIDEDERMAGELGRLVSLLGADAKAHLNAFLDALAKRQRAQREIADELIELGLSLEAIVANFPFTDQALEALADGQTDLNAIFPYPLATVGHATR